MDTVPVHPLERGEIERRLMEKAVANARRNKGPGVPNDVSCADMKNDPGTRTENYRADGYVIVDWQDESGGQIEDSRLRALLSGIWSCWD